jgi:hypothetical protein
MEDTDMKKTYIKPNLCVMLLRHKTMLLAGSVINPGDKNVPAGSRIWDDDWDEDE